MTINFPFRGETEILTDEIRSSVQGEFIQLTDGLTHYMLEGPEDAQIVVLVHGFSVPYYIWDPTFQTLVNAGYRVLRFDLFGRGFSDRPDLKYDQNLFARQLYELLDGLEITKPINLAGLSMGGAIVASFTAAHPQRIKKLILVDPAGHPLKTPWYFKLFLLPGVAETIINVMGSDVIIKRIARDFFDPKEIDVFIDRYRVQMKYKGFVRALLSTMRNGMLADFSDTYHRVGATGIPTLLIWGREDKTIPFSNSKFILAAIPDIEFHPIDESGHIPHYEKPEEVNPILLDFLTNFNQPTNQRTSY